MSEPFDLTTLGQFSDREPYEVTAEAIAAYAAATNDTSPEAASGEVAPAVFAIVPVFGRAAGHPVVVEDRRAELAGRIVHGEQWMVFHRPIRAGDRLLVRGATIGVHAKSSGVTVISKMETTDEAGAAVNDQYVTVFYRGIASEHDTGEIAPTLRSLRGDEEGTELAPVTFPIDTDQPARYAEASGDHNRIHLDDDFARSVGLPGIIVHGMCTLAFASRAVGVALSEPSATSARQIGCRFTRPLLPGDSLTTEVFHLEPPTGSGARDGARAARFACMNGARETVLGAGYVEFAG